MTDNDRTILRDLARRYMEICSKPEIDERRALWRRHNSLKRTRPLIYVRAFAWNEMPEAQLACEDPFFRHFEDFFRHQLFWDSMADDSIFEPWVTVHATYRCAGWGVSGERHRSDEEGGSFKVDYPLKREEDIEKLRAPQHEIDEETTAAMPAGWRTRSAISSRSTWTAARPIACGPATSPPTWATCAASRTSCWTCTIARRGCTGWSGSCATASCGRTSRPRRPATGACPRIRTRPCPTPRSCADPAPNVNGVPRKQLWGFMAAQEFDAGVARHARRVPAAIPAPDPEPVRPGRLRLLRGPDPQDRHAAPDPEPAPHRRLAVRRTLAKCAEQIGTDYVLCYRPSPADMVGYGFDPDRIRSILRRDLAACRACHVDITLKDVETVQGDPNRVRQWVALTRQVIDEVARVMDARLSSPLARPATR